MHIGIQAFGFHGQTEGQANYCRELIVALAAVDRVNRYTLFTNSFRRKARVCAAIARRVGEAIRVVCTTLPDVPHPSLLAMKERLWERAARRLGVEVFHATSYRPIGSGTLRSVVTVQDVSFLRLRETLPKRALGYYRALEERLAMVDRLIVPSDSTRRDVLRDLSLEAHRVVVVPHGVETARFRPDADPAAVQAMRRRLELAQPYLLYVGALTGRKNLGALLHAYHRLRRGGAVDAELVLAGQPADDTARLRRLIDELELRRQVRVLGYVSAEELPLLYASAEVFIYPSLLEGFGLPVLEAMASGVPVVAAEATSIPEVAGEAALLVDAADPERLAEGIRRAVEDDQWRRHACRQGLERAARYSWEATAKATLRVYEAAGVRDRRHPVEALEAVAAG